MPDTISKPSAEEVMESLTGFDEIAIAQSFGLQVLKLADEQPTMLTRALVFILLRRDEGLRDPDAKQRVMEMSLKQVQAQLVDDEDEVLEGDVPVTPAGKGDLQLDGPLMTSPL